MSDTDDTPPDDGGGFLDVVGDIWDTVTGGVDAGDPYAAPDATADPWGDPAGDEGGDPWGDPDTVAPDADTVTQDLLTPDHPEWAAVTAKLEKMAERNLNVMVEHMQLGADAFRDDANDMITEYIKEPPKDFSAFALVADVVMGAVGVFVPVVGVAFATVAATVDTVEAVSETVKIVYDNVKAAKGVWDEVKDVEVASTVEGAKEQLRALTGDFAEDFGRRAVSGYQQSLNTLETTIAQYLTQVPQPVPADDAAYQELCTEMGLGATDDSSVDAFVNQMMPKFRMAVMTQTARLNFYNTLDDDYERLDFLIDQEEAGNVPEDLLALIGADVPYWKQFLDFYRGTGGGDAGRYAARTFLQNYLMSN